MGRWWPFLFSIVLTIFCPPFEAGWDAVVGNVLTEPTNQGKHPVTSCLVYYLQNMRLQKKHPKTTISHKHRVHLSDLMWEEKVLPWYMMYLWLWERRTRKLQGLTPVKSQTDFMMLTTLWKVKHTNTSMNKERGPHRCCCDKGPCPVPDFGSGSSWGLCCDRHVLHRWDLCAALGTPGAEGAPDCADYCRSHESLEKSRRNKRRDDRRIRRMKESQVVQTNSIGTSGGKMGYNLRPRKQRRWK